MSFLAPIAFVAGLLGAAAVVALHLLTTRRPPPAPLPTARFVPLAEARAVARARRPTDLVLLALRALAVVLIGSAFARPILDAPGPRVRSVVLLDLSAAVASPGEAAAAARAAIAEGSALVVFDTAARAVPLDSLDPLIAAAVADPARPARGALSPALVAARRVAGEVARGADSLRLVIVSPLTDAGLDAATISLRAAWPGRAEIVRVAAAAPAGPSIAPVLLTDAADDPLIAALARLGERAPAHPVRIVRRAPVAADSAWVRERGRVLLAWPGTDAAPAPDAVHVPGVDGVTLVAPLARGPAGRGRVVAMWRDGAPAVTEAPIAAGCVRTVGVGLPVAGDLALREPFARFLGAMMAPCGGPRGTPLPDSAVAALAGAGPLAPARLLVAADRAGARLPALLLALALLGLTVEWVLRRRAAA